MKWNEIAEREKIEEKMNDTHSHKHTQKQTFELALGISN